ncbi:hypothetical protein EDC94DRAFT_594528 [Helicostylum pulchrum]|uniref:Uncharacterized protein n=1 Tax=Helicostylum pulchrum TaxID=562976 RepID=A0ABP9XQE0_9FUNG|nr:hypothetical protein EDC94DRAFT_594528 [Helicostylum pulchrum]
MQPWADKSSGSHTNTLHYDKTLSHLNNNVQQQSSSSSSNGFRTARDTTSTVPSFEFETREKQGSSSNNYSFFEPAQQQTMPLTDGAEVMSFLNSQSYSDQVYSDDLRPDSMSYISHRHQVDTQHGLAEKEKLRLLFGTEDIVEYLKNTTYTEDVYNIPVLGQLIKQAQEEIKQHKHVAIDRLSMIRNHLVHKANGDFELAAKNAFGMTQDDWSDTFLDSS